MRRAPRPAAALTASALALALSSAATQGAAQTAAQDPSLDTAGESSDAISVMPTPPRWSMTVLTERRDSGARLIDEPVAVDIIEAEELALIAPDHPAEILTRAPGALIHRGNGQEHLTAIRSPVLTGDAGAGSFLFLQDGIALRAAGFANVNALFEAHWEAAEAVEVLRGPSGVVYGANALHGAVYVDTLGPGAGSSLSLSADSQDRLKAAAIWDAERLGALAAFSVLHEDGFRAESGLDQQKLTAVFEARAGGWDVETILSAQNLNQETAGFVEGPSAYRDPALRLGNPNPEAYRDARSARLLSRWSRDGTGWLGTLTPYARWTDMEFLQHFLPSKAVEENGHWSAGLQSGLELEPARLWGGPEGLLLLTGADLEWTEGYLTQVQSIPTVFSYVQGVQYDYAVSSLEAAAFAEADWRLTDDWRLIAGARLTALAYDYDNRTADGVFGRFLRRPDRTDDFDALTYHAALSRRLGGGDHFAYAKSARGVRAPQAAELYRLQINQDPSRIQPETIDSLELGFKGALDLGGVGRPMRYDLTLFHMDKSHVNFRDADGFNVSDGETRHQGVEMQLDWRPSDAWRLTANASWADHTYRFDRPVLSIPQATEAISAGDKVDTAPEWIGSAQIGWRPSDALELQADWVFVSDYFMDAANTQTYPGHDLLNLTAVWRTPNGVSVTARLRNALDERYAERADFAFGDERYFTGEDRTLSLTLKAPF